MAQFNCNEFEKLVKEPSTQEIEIRKQAGVKAPEFIYLELLEEGVL